MPNVYYRDRDSSALAWGLVAVAVVILLAALLFVFAGNRTDNTTLETPQVQEPIVIEQPVIEEVPVPVSVPVENTVIREREVQVPAPPPASEEGEQTTPGTAPAAP